MTHRNRFGKAFCNKVSLPTEYFCCIKDSIRDILKRNWLPPNGIANKNLSKQAIVELLLRGTVIKFGKNEIESCAYHVEDSEKEATLFLIIANKIMEDYQQLSSN